MRDGRVIALAGQFQACALVSDLARNGRADPAAAESSIASVFRIEAESVSAVFGGLSGLRFGLETLLRHLDGNTRDPTLAPLVLSVMRLERRYARSGDTQQRLRSGIEAIAREARADGIIPPDARARLAALYCDTLSRLEPRVVVHGQPRYLDDTGIVEQIRALLMAALRSAVLWRQLHGSRLRMLVHRREYAMLARGLLTRSTLDLG